MKRWLFILLIGCAGCERFAARDASVERADSLYQLAMSEYAAGRLDKSLDVFEKIVRAHPGNASARFQLACLLQDYRNDPLGAICQYREYQRLSPKGDRAGIAADRAAACERQLAPLLVKKFGLGGSVAQDEANQRLAADKEQLKKELEEAKQERGKLQQELDALRRENTRVRRMVQGEGADEADAGVAKGVRGMPTLPDEKELLEDDAEGVDQAKLAADVAHLMDEEKEETREATPFGATARPAAAAKSAAREPLHEKRPEYYVVQEGDTLFKLAMRFYGRRSAWKTIREANKASVTTSGDIRAGQRLRLP